ncbi:hypothetical protein WR25_04201 [Diploscapter pachys]|uniref:CX domain-containing protein n=1 Tax=Diploscapter pachys TaxID=2018661 RepID=A0A2A2JTJ7_9BILA|nr:hypothetical protein WR25_04201 [Diploscapter pachys]
MSRWDSLPISEQEQAYLASTTTTTHDPSLATTLKQNLAGLIRQEISDSGQNICFYRFGTADTAVPYMCDLGCCNHGCCTVGDIAAKNNSFGWAIALLIVVIITIIFALLALLSVWLLNRHKDKIHKQQLAESTIESSSISGPTSFYHPDYYQPKFGAYQPY